MEYFYFILLICGFVLNTEAVKYPEYPPCTHNSCPVHEIFNECASRCYIEPTCQNPEPVQPTFCTEECTQRCFCEKGYIRDANTKTCVRIEDCPSCTSYCPVNEIFNECASRCYIEPTCQNPDPVQPTMCTDECAQRCFCDAGYIRDENTRTCVRIEDCPSCTSYCSANEVFNECASRCYIEPTCQNPNPVQPTICTKECAQRCFCDAGYIRDENTKTCVRIQDCPSCPSLCDPYTEVFNECASACQPEPTCQDPNPTSSQFCTLQCVQRCECAYGFIRDAVTKLCVPACECPVCPDECGPNKHMGCKPCCPESVETCQNTHPKLCNGYCTYECRPSCVCDEGFIRNEITDECVPRQQCPSSHKFHYHH